MYTAEIMKKVSIGDSEVREVIIHHYFDEAKQEKASSVHSAHNSYSEALEQVEMFEQLGGYDGWFEIKQVTTYSDRVYGM